MTTEAVSAPVADTKAQTLEALEAIHEIFSEYIAWPSPEAADAVTLWVAHAHVFYAFEATPRLSISSRQPGSGKSRVLEIIKELVPSPLDAVYMTPGVMWRVIEHTAPTILLDEVDTIFGKSGSSSAHRYLRGIINAGHRKGATVPRCVGSDDVKQFGVFAPVAMAGLGSLPETIATRSISVEMRRRRADQKVRPFRLKFAQDALNRARSLLEMWAEDSADDLEFACPDLPVSDRAADVWEPLIAIAQMAGEEWHKRAINACKELSANGKNASQSVSPGIQLLTDLREVFGEEPVMFTAEIIERLSTLPDRVWSAEKLSPRSLGRILADYGVRPSTVRRGDSVAKGYKAEDLSVAWERYVKAEPDDDDL